MVPLLTVDSAVIVPPSRLMVQPTPTVRTLSVPLEFDTVILKAFIFITLEPVSVRSAPALLIVSAVASSTVPEALLIVSTVPGIFPLVACWLIVCVPVPSSTISVVPVAWLVVIVRSPRTYIVEPFKFDEVFLLNVICRDTYIGFKRVDVPVPEKYTS